MADLRDIRCPDDLKRLDPAELDDLASQIRRFLITHVARTGGHLGPNLGVVELTIALHRVFDSPDDPIVFDTGHQGYVHKILTGRQIDFDRLRQKDGLSGYLSRAESAHDWVENSHASAALAWAEGMAQAFALSNDAHNVVAVVGDGALTGGMAWEALNSIATSDLRLVIVVNDNGRSYRPTIGGLSKQLAAFRTDPRYEQTLGLVKRVVSGTPVVGQHAYELLHGFKAGVKDVVAPQTMFSDLGLKYLGPINGHDIEALESAFAQAKDYDGPVIVHCITSKGHGFKAAEDNVDDQFHAVGLIDDVTGDPLQALETDTWTDAFGATMLRLGGDRDDIVAISAAMTLPTGLGPFQAAYSERCFDAGIAEQHAVTMAAGLATMGYHPVVAIYSTFLNRAFDQLLMDASLHQRGVTLALDRAGITGPDGPSHHGMWDIPMLSIIPDVQLAAPRDQQRLEQALERAVGIDDALTVLRYPKGALPQTIPALRHLDGVDVLRDPATASVLLVGYGAMAEVALGAANRLSAHGIEAMVVDPVWALPVSDCLAELAERHDLTVTVEDNLVVGGLGAQLSAKLRQSGVDVPVRELGIPHQFVPQGSRSEVLLDLGLDAASVAERVRAWLERA